jgi:hypothetical protein
MPRALALFRDFRRALGTARALRALPLWVLRPEFSVLVLDLGRPPAPGPAATELDWAPLDERDVPELLAINPALPEAEVRRWFEEGNEAVLARREGELVHFRAYLTGRVELPYLGACLQLDDGDVLLGWVYTAAQWRRSGLLATAAAWSQQHVRARGHRRMVALVARWNAAPARTAERVGMEVVGQVGCWRFGPWRRHFARGAAFLDRAGRIRLPPATPRPAARDVRRGPAVNRRSARGGRGGAR